MSLVIIGSGLAGYLLLKALRDQGYVGKITVITAEAGHFYTKPMLSNACARNKQPHDLVSLDADQMVARYDFVLHANSQVIDIDRQARCIHLGDGQTLAYEKCVLAVGAQPNLLPDGQEAHVMRVNDWQAYYDFHAQVGAVTHLAVLGGGLVGTEFVADWVTQCPRLSWYHDGPYPLHRLLPAAMGEALLDRLQALGVTWYGESDVEVIEAVGQYKHITTTSQSRQSCDVILAATGLRPNTDLAEKIGLQTHHGIVVDRHCVTSDPHIYALGDCAEVAGLSMFYVAPIRHCVATIVQHIGTGQAEPVHYPVMPITLKTPMLPIVVSPPAQDAEGAWVVTGEAPHFEAQYVSTAGDVLGFALSGEQVKQRAKWMQRVPAVLPPSSA